MKKIIIILSLMISCACTFAEPTVSNNQQVIETTYTFEDKDGTVYPIYLQNGRAFIIKHRDGKIIKKWLGSNVAETILKSNPS